VSLCAASIDTEVVLTKSHAFIEINYLGVVNVSNGGNPPYCSSHCQRPIVLQIITLRLFLIEMQMVDNFTSKMFTKKKCNAQNE
jgi:hypothetical protein